MVLDQIRILLRRLLRLCLVARSTCAAVGAATAAAADGDHATANVEVQPSHDGGFARPDRPLLRLKRAVLRPEETFAGGVAQLQNILLHVVLDLRDHRAAKPHDFENNV